jgi:hypothetical protein
VDNKRFIENCGERDVFLQRFSLFILHFIVHFSRSEIVQAALPDRDNFFIFCERAHFFFRK